MRRITWFALFALALAATACAPKATPAPLPPPLDPAAIPRFLEENGFVDGDELHISRTVAPGVVHTFDSFSSGPLTLNTLVIDMTDPNLVLEAEKGKADLYNRETVPALLRRVTTPESRAIAGINADFWGDRSVPIGLFVDEGVIWKGPHVTKNGRTRSVFAWDEDGEMFIGQPDWTVAVRNADGPEVLKIGRINFPDGGEPVTAYTWPIGEKPPARAEGESRIIVRLEEPTWLPNVPASGVVEKYGDKTTMTKTTVVLSIQGSEFPAWLSTQGARVVLDARLGNLSGAVVGVVGGGPMILHQGEIVAEEQGEREAMGRQFVTDLHPRTAVGLMEDGKTLVWTVVDGRQTGRSNGINLFDLAQWLKDQGCVEGINLDGGGSSTFVVRGELTDFPSDAGGPRSVSNALVLRRTAPIGDPDRLDVSPAAGLLAPGESYILRASATDEGYEPLKLSSDWRIGWEVEEGDAEISRSGKLEIGLTEEPVMVEANARLGFLGLRGRLEGTAEFEVRRPVRVEFQPPAALLRDGESVSIQLHAYDEYGRSFWIPEGVQNPALPAFLEFNAGTQSIRAESKGAGFVTVEFGGVEARLPVAAGTYSQNVVLDCDKLPADDPSQWLVASNYASDKTSLELEKTNTKEGAAAWRFTYAMAHGGTTKIAMPVDVALPGEPLALGFWMYGDGQGQWFRGELSDANGSRYYLDFTGSAKGVDWKDEWRFVRASLVNPPAAGRPKGPFTYPLKLETLYVVQPQEAAKRDGVVLIDGITTYELPPELRRN